MMDSGCRIAWMVESFLNGFSVGAKICNCARIQRASTLCQTFFKFGRKNSINAKRLKFQAAIRHLDSWKLRQSSNDKKTILFPLAHGYRALFTKLLQKHSKNTTELNWNASTEKNREIPMVKQLMPCYDKKHFKFLVLWFNFNFLFL